MTTGYPTNQDEAGEFHPPGSKSDDDAGTTKRQPLSGLEVAIIVATVASFLLIVFFVFYCRRVEQRRRATADDVRRAEAGHAGGDGAQESIAAVDVPRAADKNSCWPATAERCRPKPTSQGDPKA